MKVAIMQPYFLPYLGYYAIMKHVDRYIVFDTVQFIYHGWIERNRILKPSDGWQYIKVPLIKHKRDCKIKDIRINNEENWKERLFVQIAHYKKKAPYYYAVRELLETVLKNDYDSIVSLNVAMDHAVMTYLGSDKNIEVYSEMELKITSPTAPDEWALNICQALGNVDEYWNAPGGIDFFDREKYDKAGIKLRFVKTSLDPYQQGREPFTAGLSVLDVMMFNAPETVASMLDQYSFI